MTTSCKYTAFLGLRTKPGAASSLHTCPQLPVPSARHGGGAGRGASSSGTRGFSSEWGSGPSGDPSCCRGHTVPKWPSPPGRPWQPRVGLLFESTKWTRSGPGRPQARICCCCSVSRTNRASRRSKSFNPVGHLYYRWLQFRFVFSKEQHIPGDKLFGVG